MWRFTFRHDLTVDRTGALAIPSVLSLPPLTRVSLGEVVVMALGMTQAVGSSGPSRMQSSNAAGATLPVSACLSTGVRAPGNSTPDTRSRRQRIPQGGLPPATGDGESQSGRSLGRWPPPRLAR